MAGFQMRTLVADPFLSADAVPPGIELATLDRVLRESDLISIHVPLGPQTREAFGRRSSGR